jgi:hypothetical protein
LAEFKTAGEAILERSGLMEEEVDEFASTHCGSLGSLLVPSSGPCMILNDLHLAFLGSLQCARFCDFAPTSVLRNILAMWQGINVFITKWDMAI